MLRSACKGSKTGAEGSANASGASVDGGGGGVEGSMGCCAAGVAAAFAGGVAGASGGGGGGALDGSICRAPHAGAAANRNAQMKRFLGMLRAVSCFAQSRIHFGIMDVASGRAG